MRHISTIVFFAGLLGGGGVLWSMSLSKWGADEAYVIVGRQYGQVGAAQPVHAPRLSLQKIKGAERRPIEVAVEIYEAVRENDQLQIKTRLIPVIQGELTQYTLLRGGAPVRTWDEGWFFYAVAIGIASLLIAGILTALWFWLQAALRLKPPQDT